MVPGFAAIAPGDSAVTSRRTRTTPHYDVLPIFGLPLPPADRSGRQVPMSSSAALRRSGFWIIVSLYGLALAALVFVLKYIEYRFLVRDLSAEVYIGVVAVLFTALGVWVGGKLLADKKKDVPASPPQVLDEAAVRALGISARELDVLQLMAQGHPNQAIADKLFISLPTVKSHSSNLFSKLEVKSRTQAVLKAKAAGIIP